MTTTSGFKGIRMLPSKTALLARPNNIAPPTRLRFAAARGRVNVGGNGEVCRRLMAINRGIAYDTAWLGGSSSIPTFS